MKKKILIVEDNELNLKLFRDLLEAHDFETFETKDGNEAVHLTKTRRPDLILMDIQLPEVSGLDITKRIMGIVRVEAVCRGKTVQLERRAAGIIGRPMHQTGIAAPDSKDGGQDVEPIVAVELRGIDVRLKVLEEGLAQHLLIEPDAVEAHPCRRRPTFS